MSVFGNYARYYDLLYKDKDYSTEAAFVDGIIQRIAPGARTVLELGCGTGAHMEPLVRKGYEITGVDLSAEMLKKAGERARGLGEAADRVTLLNGDIRSVRAGKRFDAVISLFHVMSYQTGNDDLKAAFDTAREHLNPGGLFLFDCWYGPGVLTDRPAVRVKTLEDDKIKVLRTATPVLRAGENVVDVNYGVVIIDKASWRAEELAETHSMRYLFSPEVEVFLSLSGFELIESAEWLTGRRPGFDTWQACFSARAV